MDPIEVQFAAANLAPVTFCELPASGSVVQTFAEHDIMFIRPSQESFAGVVIEDLDYNYKVCLTQDHVALLIQELAHMALLNIGPLSYKARAGGITGTPPAIRLNIDLHV